MESNHPLRRWPLLACSALMAFGMAPAFAQDAEEDAPEEVEELVVTGSYIKRSAQDSPSPLTVISAVDIEQSHIADVQELLLRLPYESGGWIRASTFDGGGGQGRIPINLRNLGECATLPLVNGRRHTTGWMTPAGCAAVDTNSMVPTLMLERVEILKDGSSALYGSDAIAGVVNFITRDNFEGLDFDARFLTDEATGQGDEISFGLVFGTQGDRGGFVVGADYLRRNEIPTQDPAIYEIQGGFGYSDTGQPGWYPPQSSAALTFADGTPFPDEVGRLTPRNSSPRLPGTSGWESDWGYADLDCEAVAAWDGYGGALGLFSSGAGENTRCPIDYGNFFSIQEEELLQKIYATGHYSITDSLELSFEGGYSEQEFWRFNSLAPQTRTPVIPAHNHALINDAARRGMTPVPLVNRSRLIGGTPLTPFHVRPIRTQQDGDRDTFRAAVGLTWDVNFMERPWTVNAFFTTSESSQYQYNVEDSRATETVLALHGLGGPNCNSADKDDAWKEENRGSGNRTYRGGTLNRDGTWSTNFEDGACYYLNPFGSAIVDASGNFRDPVTNPNVVTLPDGTQTSISNPPDLLQWLDGTWQQNDEFEQRVVDLVAAGEIMDLPAGPVGLAVGYQQRVTSLLRHYDINFRQFNAAFRFGGSNVAGTVTTDAQFMELQVPITQDVETQIAIRRENFDEIDTSTVDPKVSVLYRPSDELTIRGSFGSSFRVGSILQLIGPQTIVSNTDDPYNDTSFFIPWISAGADLEPEESQAVSFGFTWVPQEGMLEGLTATMDAWQIDFEQLITKESAPGLLFSDGCARAAADPSVPVPARCAERAGSYPDGYSVQEKVIRNTGLNPVRILPDFINADQGTASGVDIELSYRIDTDGMGMFTLGTAMAYFHDYTIETDDGRTFEGVGTMGILTPIARPLPQWKINYNINWAMGNHNVFWQTRFVDEVDWDGGWSGARASRVMRATGRDIGSYAWPDNPYVVPTTWWTDAYYSYTLPTTFGLAEGATVTFGVRNLFAEEPPVANSANGYSAILHDARGRMFMLRYRVSI